MFNLQLLWIRLDCQRVEC